jgi:hypothetical protein
MGAHPFLDTGPLWFVEVLLLYSLAYAWWRARRPAPRDGSTPLTPGALARLAVAVSTATVLVRLVFPIASQQPAHPNLWQWPQYVALFCLGVVAAERGWLRPVPRDLARRAGRMAAGGVAAFLALGVALAATGSDGDVLFHDRLHWAPITLAVIEGPLAVGASVWVLAVAQRRLAAPMGRMGRAVARSAFAAFVVQGIVLIGLQIALRPVAAGAGAKALVVALLGPTGSFALAWLLVTRTPAGRVL